jgi:hypothetical protein
VVAGVGWQCDAGGIHFVDVAPTPKLLETHLPSLFTHEDYPLLVPEGEPVETVALGTVMAVRFSTTSMSS